MSFETRERSETKVVVIKEQYIKCDYCGRSIPTKINDKVPSG